MQVTRAPTSLRSAARSAGVPFLRAAARRPVRIVNYKDDEKVSPTEVLDNLTSTSTQTSPRPAYNVPLLIPALTRRREIVVGRWAQIGFFAACLGELFLPGHYGPLGQIHFFTGMSAVALNLGFTAVLLHGLTAILWPDSPTYDKENVEDFLQRPRGPATSGSDPSMEPDKFLNPPVGLSAIGFSKKNELFNGRMAMLGFLAAIVNEKASGGLGPLGQLAWWGGSFPDEHFYSVAAMGLGLWIVTWYGLSLIPGANKKHPDDDLTY